MIVSDLHCFLKNNAGPKQSRGPPRYWKHIFPAKIKLGLRLKIKLCQIMPKRKIFLTFSSILTKNVFLSIFAIFDFLRFSVLTKTVLRVFRVTSFVTFWSSGTGESFLINFGNDLQLFWLWATFYGYFVTASSGTAISTLTCSKILSKIRSNLTWHSNMLKMRYLPKKHPRKA